MVIKNVILLLHFSVTPEDGRIRVEAILKKNEENKFTLTPEQVKENLIRA